MFSRVIFVVGAALLSCTPTAAQTYSTCNPLQSSNCPPDTALGKAINVDFTQGSVNSFTASGNPTYDSNGVSFTVAQSGDAPQLTSLFYIMFGKVELTMKAAPGAGIVSSLVLQSDDLDEIDMEWLGADSTEVQTNYFGKGEVTTYNRGQFNPAPNNQGEFITYTIEWTQSQIMWSVGSTIVRVLTPETADANQYPQTPMQVKFGAWSGGDPSNPPGTIAWARGPTNYADGPYTMIVQSLAVTDYSTGTQYKYGDNSGEWQSIEAVGGKVNGNSGGAAASVASADIPAATSASPSIPAGLGGKPKDSTITQTGWPWVATATTLTTAGPVYTTAPGVPSGWVISSNGKVVPADSAATISPALSSFAAPWPSPSSPPSSGSALETITGWDDRGFPTTRTEVGGRETQSKSYNQQGFLITGSSTMASAAAATAPTGTTNSLSTSVFGSVAEAGNVVSTTASKGAAPEPAAWHGTVLWGIAAVAVERLLLGFL